MKRLMGLMIFGLLMGGLSAGGAWLVRSKQMAAEAAKAAEDAPPAKVEKLERPKVESSTPTAKLPDSIPAVATEDDMLPVPIRPKPYSPEELVHMALALKARAETVRQREEAILRMEARQKLVMADLNGEQKEMEGLFVQVRDQRLATEDLIKKADLRLQELVGKEKQIATRKEELSVTEEAVDESRALNIEKMATVFQGMEPSNAAGTLKSLANDGKIDMAVQLLHKLEERKAAEIIEALNDEALTGEILQKYVDMKQPPVEKKKRR